MLPVCVFMSLRSVVLWATLPEWNKDWSIINNYTVHWNDIALLTSYIATKGFAVSAPSIWNTLLFDRRFATTFSCFIGKLFVFIYWRVQTSLATVIKRLRFVCGMMPFYKLCCTRLLHYIAEKQGPIVLMYVSGQYLSCHIYFAKCE